MAFASICPLNMGISKLTSTLKGEVPQKCSLDEYTLIFIGMQFRIWEKLSIISSLYRVRACSSNILIKLPSLSFLFSFSMEGFLGVREIFSSRETSSRPNLLYLDLVRDMH
jgi:hypothetical protein